MKQTLFKQLFDIEALLELGVRTSLSLVWVAGGSNVHLHQGVNLGVQITFL